MKLRHVLAAEKPSWQTVVFYCIVVEGILDSLERQKASTKMTIEKEALHLPETNCFLSQKRRKWQNIERKISLWNKTGNQLADLISKQDGLALKYFKKDYPNWVAFFIVKSAMKYNQLTQKVKPIK